MRSLIVGGMFAMILACGLPQEHTGPSHHRVPTTTRSHDMVMLTPIYSIDSGWTGRYAYQNNDSWYYYNFPMSAPVPMVIAPTNVSASTPTPPTVVVPSYSGNTIPPGGTWSVSNSPPPPEDIESIGDVMLAESPSGAPTIDGWEITSEEVGEGNVISDPVESEAGGNEAASDGADAGASDVGGFDGGGFDAGVGGE